MKCNLEGKRDNFFSMKTVTSFTGLCNLTDVATPGSGVQCAGS